MNILEYLLICTAEEAVEVATEATIIQELVTKSVTWSSFLQKVQEQPNIVTPLVAEINDLIGCLELLIDYGLFNRELFDREVIEQKHKTLEDAATDYLPPLVLACLEIQKTVSKILRFGTGDTHPVSQRSSVETLHCNVNHFIACMDYCKVNNLQLQCLFDRNAISFKKAKVRKYLKRAQDSKIIDKVMEDIDAC